LRTIIGSFAGLLAFAVVSAQAAPIAARPMQAEIAAAPSIELVRQGERRHHGPVDAIGVGVLVEHWKPIEVVQGHRESLGMGRLD